MSTAKAAYEALVAGGPGVTSKPIPGTGRFETYTPPSGGQPYFRVVIDFRIIDRVFGRKLSEYQLRKRTLKVESNIREALLNVPREARGHLFYGVEGHTSGLWANTSLPVLFRYVLFNPPSDGGPVKDPDLRLPAQILTNLVDETPNALDGDALCGSLSFLAIAASAADRQMMLDGGVYDIGRAWSLREAIFDDAQAADLQMNSKADQVR